MAATATKPLTWKQVASSGEQRLRRGKRVETGVITALAATLPDHTLMRSSVSYATHLIFQDNRGRIKVKAKTVKRQADERRKEKESTKLKRKVKEYILVTENEKYPLVIPPR